MFRTLRHRRYRLWAGAGLVSSTGTWMQLVAQNWLVLKLTGSPAAVGMTVMLQALPGMLLGLWGGAFVDRVATRHHLLVATQSLYAVLAVVLAALTFTGAVNVWAVEALALGVGLVGVFDGPANTVFGTELVPAEDLSSAIALGSLAGSAARVVGMAAAGVVIAVAGAGAVFVVNAVSYLGVVAVLARIGGAASAAAAARASTAPRSHGVRTGLAYVRRHPRLPLLFALLFVLGSFGRNFQVTMAAMTSHVFGAGAGAYGAASTAFAIGAVAGAVVAAKLRRLGVAALLIAAASAAALEVLAGLAPRLDTFVAVMVPIAAAAVVVDTAAQACVQLDADPAVRGRVTAVSGMVSGAAGAVGGPLLGWIATSAGGRNALVAGGMVALVATLLASPGLRAVRRPGQGVALAT